MKPSNSGDIHKLSYKDSRGNKDVRVEGLARYAEPKKPNAAGPITYNTLTCKDTYKTGMGDIPVAIRPGALDFKKYRSKGLE